MSFARLPAVTSLKYPLTSTGIATAYNLGGSPPRRRDAIAPPYRPSPRSLSPDSPTASFIATSLEDVQVYAPESSGTGDQQVSSMPTLAFSQRLPLPSDSSLHDEQAQSLTPPSILLSTNQSSPPALGLCSMSFSRDSASNEAISGVDDTDESLISPARREHKIRDHNAFIRWFPSQVTTEIPDSSSAQGDPSHSPSSPAPSNPDSIAKQSVSELYPQILALPIARRPLFPDFYKAVVVRNPAVVATIKEMMKRGQSYLGAFLLKDENSNNDDGYQLGPRSWSFRRR
ncbi:hypothetical protein NLJ89_g10690 [Agrocybe chaxingu]|uniref:Lon N-terminal domain-containing protein n=1 Tax=Agrocybe chaxingu TaxID=84603 RepID=A0A9W8MRW5_9AGAR|nr:hypothetical protein NLJ89_g10690 [Agrocybe chaxingu]